MKDVDIIKINYHDYEKLIKRKYELDNDTEIKSLEEFIPILKKGLFVFENKENNINGKFNITDDIVDMTVSVFQENKEYRMATIKFEIKNPRELGDLTGKVLKFLQNKVKPPRKPNSRDKGIMQEYFKTIKLTNEFNENNKKQIANFIKVFVITMYSMQQILYSQEIVIKQSEGKRGDVVTPADSNKYYKTKDIAINCNDVVYRYSGNPDNISKEYQRHIESWTVRGHVRRLKNGKLIQVKPHVKGKKEVTPKIYKVKL